MNFLLKFTYITGSTFSTGFYYILPLTPFGEHESLIKYWGVHWVPGHFNIPGNESADELARLGYESTVIGFENSVKPPTSFRQFIDTPLGDLKKNC